MKRKFKTEIVEEIISVLTLLVLIIMILTSCTKHVECTCENEQLGYKVRVDITNCPDYSSCEELNGGHFYDCRKY